MWLRECVVKQVRQNELGSAAEYSGSWDDANLGVACRSAFASHSYNSSQRDKQLGNANADIVYPPEKDEP